MFCFQDGKNPFIAVTELLLLQKKTKKKTKPKISIEFPCAAFFRHFETHIEKLFHLSMPLKADNK